MALVKISQSLSRKYFPFGLRGLYSATRAFYCSSIDKGDISDRQKQAVAAAEQENVSETAEKLHEQNDVTATSPENVASETITSNDISSQEPQAASHDHQEEAQDYAAHAHHEYHESHDHQASHDQESHDEEYGEDYVKARLFQAALSQVHEHGWSREAIIAGAELEGLPAVTHGLFPRGGADLVNHFYVQCNRDLEAALEEQVRQMEEAGQKIKITSFIRSAVQDRLLMVAPYKDTWPQAMGIQALPTNALTAWCNLTDLVDTIWYHAGDRSADMNWYTKRATLAAVYKSTELHMLQDNSEELSDTWLFLDRRLTDLATFGKCVRKTKDAADNACESLTGVGMLAQNMLGVSRNR